MERSNMPAMSNKLHGFTIVELVIAISVMAILTPLVLNSLGGYFYSSTTSLGTTSLDTNTRYALRQIESDLAHSQGFLDSALVQYSENGPTNAVGASTPSALTWTYTGTNNLLLAQTSATNSAGDMVALTSNSGNCAPDAANVMKNLVVYFVSNNTLYRRTIVNWSPSGTPPTTCTGYTPNTQTKQKTSCAAATISSNCFAKDAVLLHSVSSLAVDFYSQSTDTSPIAISGITSAQTAEVSITTNKKINGQDKQSTAKIRFTIPTT